MFRVGGRGQAALRSRGACDLNSGFKTSLSGPFEALRAVRAGVNIDQSLAASGGRSKLGARWLKGLESQGGVTFGKLGFGLREAVVSGSGAYGPDGASQKGKDSDGGQGLLKAGGSFVGHTKELIVISRDFLSPS